MSQLGQDQAFEAEDARPLIETWLLRYATFIAVGCVLMACVSLYGAMKVNARTTQMFAVTDRGYTFQLPIYADVAHAQAAAKAIDDAEGAPARKLMGHVRTEDTP